MQTDLLNIFFEESEEHLQSLNENVLVLEQNPADMDVVGEIFRSAHTFKGMSASMEFTEMADLTHKMENVLDEIRHGNIVVNADIIDVIFECIDNLEKMVADVQQGGMGNIDVASTKQKLEALLNGNVETPTEHIEQNHIDTDDGVSHEVHITVEQQAILKAVRAIMCIEALQNVGNIQKTAPSIEEIEADAFGFEFTVFMDTDCSIEELKQVVLHVSEIEKVEVKQGEPISKEVASKKVVTQEVVQVEGKLQPAVATQVESPIEATNQPSSAMPAKSTTKTKNAKVENRSIRVQLEKIERLMNMFEESVIERGRIDELAQTIQNKELIEHLNRLGDISKDIQNVLLNMRMVPIETVFNRFPRMVRMLAKDLGKKIDLQITGEDTEVDKIVIDEIGDPLVHLIRNAIDHGIETVEKRRDAGKNETGTIKLEAFHSGNHVVIQITDDGNGINKGKVLEKAIKNGVVTEADANRLTDREVFDLIFQPGFSTAEVVSDLSGRGVGLDVVKHTIHSLGGHLIIDSEEGKGSTFRIELPLTLSIIQSMLVQTNDKRYALPLGNIVEAIRIKREDIQSLQGKDVLNYRNQIIEVKHLSTVFGEKTVDEAFASYDGQMVPVLIVRNTHRSYGLIVNTIIGQREIVLKSLGDFFAESSNYFSGATILGDGRVVLILNPEGL
ncbi:chemotaxis protein CheA [Bacillus thuringiensis serovar andalousiensis]|jgi:two-component system, chemotaxis family, sensor kinase CheA|uniref:Chemotaxis protein CheA n=1 Tax=Bacillus thuringiensis TaxID=1428 RepID=A0A9X6KE28_BACTU|nr:MULTISPECIES: chemotaxis protein CheA [Bacillus cereus group]MDA2613704.1 chemotaxis protein CheA [Bacillus cereus]MDR5049677.1 chemotaxis protein CheA [Bacillus thuringiensis]MEB8554805.1 chemotaxis protein CheA [Bacillus cereus]MEB8670806.1 chemotaxis protein CheA [Bacillus cereus]MEB8723524.1 chemotaxis protein CheA [Bacillus cereus]